MSDDGELAALAALSARLGADPEQIQAAGGNTSLKRQGVLWVKASGLWLADALVRPCFVPIDLAAVLAAIEADAADPVAGTVRTDLTGESLRPSIETSLHALLPHPVVIHTHSVRTLALAIRDDGEALLAKPLAGLAWRHLPYHHPGVPLTRAVRAALRVAPGLDVLVLGNHGLVVGGASLDAAADLLALVERRLDTPMRYALPSEVDPGLAGFGAAHGLRPALHAASHAPAFDLPRLASLGAGSYYPDHVIFLGPAATLLADPRRDQEVAAMIAAGRSRGSRLFVLPGRGVLLEASADRSADELALCLALVTARTAADARLRPIGEPAEAALLNWDAEAYRRSLAAARA